MPSRVDFVRIDFHIGASARRDDINKKPHQEKNRNSPKGSNFHTVFVISTGAIATGAARTATRSHSCLLIGQKIH